MVLVVVRRPTRRRKWGSGRKDKHHCGSGKDFLFLLLMLSVIGNLVALEICERLVL
jgi:hypothetical protein